MKKFVLSVLLSLLLIGCQSSQLPEYTIQSFATKMDDIQGWVFSDSSMKESIYFDEDVSSQSRIYLTGNDYETQLGKFITGDTNIGFISIEEFDEKLDESLLNKLKKHFENKQYSLEDYGDGFVANNNQSDSKGRYYVYMTKQYVCQILVRGDYQTVLKELNFPETK